MMDKDKRSYPVAEVPMMTETGLQSEPWMLAVNLSAGQEITRALYESLLYDRLLRQIQAEESLEDAARIAKMMLPNGWNLETGSAEELADSIVGLPETQELIEMMCWD